jgi:hypothetical protein
MGIIIFTLIGCFGILYSGRYAYWSWFQSNKYLAMTQKQRRKYRKTLWFMPQAVTFNFLDENPLFEVWSMRIASLLMIVLCVLGITAAIHGPFNIK